MLRRRLQCITVFYYRCRAVVCGANETPDSRVRDPSRVRVYLAQTVISTTILYYSWAGDNPVKLTTPEGYLIIWYIIVEPNTVVTAYLLF